MKIDKNNVHIAGKLLIRQIAKQGAAGAAPLAGVMSMPMPQVTCYLL
jgi:hypothetical protein